MGLKEVEERNFFETANSREKIMTSKTKAPL